MRANRQVDQAGRAGANLCIACIQKLDTRIYADRQAAVVDFQVAIAFFARTHIERQVLHEQAHHCGKGTIWRANCVRRVNNEAAC